MVGRTDALLQSRGSSRVRLLQYSFLRQDLSQARISSPHGPPAAFPRRGEGMERALLLTQLTGVAACANSGRSERQPRANHQRS